MMQNARDVPRLMEDPAHARREMEAFDSVFNTTYPASPPNSELEEVATSGSVEAVESPMPVVVRAPKQKSRVVVIEHPLGDLDVEVADVVVGELVIILMLRTGERMRFKPRYGQAFTIRVDEVAYSVVTLQKQTNLESRLFACQMIPLGRQLPPRKEELT